MAAKARGLGKRKVVRGAGGEWVRGVSVVVRGVVPAAFAEFVVGEEVAEQSDARGRGERGGFDVAARETEEALADGLREGRVGEAVEGVV